MAANGRYAGPGAMEQILLLGSPGFVLSVVSLDLPGSGSAVYFHSTDCIAMKEEDWQEY